MQMSGDGWRERARRCGPGAHELRGSVDLYGLKEDPALPSRAAQELVNGDWAAADDEQAPLGSAEPVAQVGWRNAQEADGQPSGYAPPGSK
jgi:hypothetical protein